MQNNIDIFRGIKEEIQKNPDNFRPAGQWLDGLFLNNSDFIIPMSDAFTKAVCEYPPDSKKIMLITWLVTDNYLSESKFGITKYEQYTFRHEVIKPEGNRLKQLITEQEFAEQAVLANSDAMEIIRDAYLSYKGALSGESIGKADLPNEKSASIQENMGTKEKIKGIFKKIPYWIYILTLFFAALLTCLYCLGWLEPIKAFIYKILLHK